MKTLFSQGFLCPRPPNKFLALRSSGTGGPQAAKENPEKKGGFSPNFLPRLAPTTFDKTWFKKGLSLPKMFGEGAQGKIRAENPFALGLGIPRLPNGKSKGFSAQIFPDLLNLKHGSFSGLRAGVFSPDSPLRPLQKVLEKKAQGPKFPKSNGRGTWKSQAQGKGKRLEKKGLFEPLCPKSLCGEGSGQPLRFSENGVLAKYTFS